jgi:hypothetical protein
MLIQPEEAAWFHTLYSLVIGFVCAQIGGVEGVVDAETFREAPLPRKMQARDLLLEHSDLVSAYVQANPDDVRELDLGLVLDWKRFVRGRFVIERDLRQYTVFLTEGDPPRAFGVLGLQNEILDMIAPPLPAMVDAVLLPWKGRIICDGLLSRFNVMFGPGVRRRLTETYKAAKASGIVTSFDPDWRPSPPAIAKKPKTLAISRFLKRCPPALDDFTRQFGPPRAEVEADNVGDYCLWQPGDGSVSRCDRVLIYPNIIAGHDLHVFVRGRRIAQVAAPPRRQWTKAQLRPPEGWRLLR